MCTTLIMFEWTKMTGGYAVLWWLKSWLESTGTGKIYNIIMPNDSNIKQHIVDIVPQ